MRQAVDSKSDPSAGDMSVVCEAKCREKQDPLHQVDMWQRERQRESNVDMHQDKQKPLPAH